MTRPETASSGSGDQDRETLLETLLASCLDRIAEGQSIDEAAIARECPEIAAELLERLGVYRELGLDDRAPPMLGTLGDYQLVRALGRGGMGVVYEARQASVDRAVALKVLPAGIAADPTTLTRFVREAKLAARLDHENIVRVFGMGVDRDTPHFAMELVQGETLARLIARRGAGIGADRGECYRLAAAFAGAAEGLEHAHARKVIHRDVKPSNLILDRDGRLRILDFGLARSEGEATLTRSRDLLGTPRYMSPEQARARQVAIDHRTDIYSLGATLYEVLTGTPPFEGRDAQETLSQILSRDPEPPRRRNAAIPPELETILLKCLEKAPAERYGTAGALAQDLRSFGRGDPIEARLQGVFERFRRKAARNRWKLAAATLVIVALGAVLFQARRAWLEAAARADREYRERVLGAVVQLELSSLAEKASGGEFGWSSILTPSSTSRTPGGDPVARALGDLDLAVAAFPGRPDAVYHRARALLQKEERQAAIESLERLRLSPSPFVPALTMLESVRRQLQETEAADRLHAEAEIAAREDWSRAWLDAQAGWLASDFARVRGAYERLLETCGEGAEPFLGCAITARVGLGHACLAAGDLVQAAREFHTAQALLPGAVHPAILEAQAWWRLGHHEAAARLLAAAHARAAAPDEAALVIADMFHSMAEAEPTVEWIQKVRDPVLRDASLCEKLQEIGRWEEAAAAGKRALALDPRSVYAYAALGWAYRLQHRYVEAREAFEAGLRLDPESYDLHHFLGSVSWCEGKYEEAVRWYGEAARLNRGFGRPELYKLAGALILAGRTEDGLERAREARRAAPNDSGGENMLGHALFQAGRLEEALESTERVLSYAAGFSFPWDRKALILLARGDEEAALEAWRAGQGKTPFHLGFFANPCLILERRGQREEALREILKAFEQVPDHAVAHRIASACLRELQGTLEPPQAASVRGQLEKTFERAKGSAWAQNSLALGLLLPATVELKDLEMAMRLALGAWTGEASSAASSAERAALGATLQAVAARWAVTGGERASCLGWLPSLPPYGALDAILVGAGDLSGCAGPGDALRALAQDEASARRLLYLEAAIDEAGGRAQDAAVKLRRLSAEDAASWEPAVRLSRLHVRTGDVETAEGELRAALAGATAWPREPWEVWLELCLVKLRREPAALLKVFPAAGDAAGYATDVRWLLEALAAGDSIRIDCGGDGALDASGRAWSRDRFALGGSPATPWAGDIASTNDDALFRTARTFLRTGPRDPQGYALPLPPGRYEVTLGFAETHASAPGLRRLSVRIEGEDVLTDFDIVREGGGRAAVLRRHEARVDDGRLEILLDHAPGLEACLGALEVRRVE